MQRGIERAFFDSEMTFRRREDMAGYPVAVLGTARQRLKYEQLESALQRVSAGVCFSPRHLGEA